MSGGGREVTINGDPRQIEPGTTLGELIRGRGDGAPVVASVNGEHVPRTDAERRVLDAGDRIEIIGIRQGG